MKPICLGSAAIAAIVIAWFWLRSPPLPTIADARSAAARALGRHLDDSTRRPSAEASPAPPHGSGSPATAAPSRPLALPADRSMTTRQVFRIVADGGRYSLLAATEVPGDFGSVRAMAWRPGMLCCRLLDASDKVVAEQTILPPYEPCLVLDPNLAPGAPVPAHLISTGPMVFQVGFPAAGSAVSLMIYRINTSRRPSEALGPVGDLLASFPLPGR